MAIDLGPIFALSPAEKLRLVQDLWDDIAANPEDVVLQDWQKEDLIRRKAEFEANPQSGLTMDEAMRRMRARHGR